MAVAVIFMDVFLLCASVEDILRLRVPIWMAPAGAAAWSLFLLINAEVDMFVSGLIGAVIVFAVTFAFVQFFDLGGADCLIATLIGYCLGMYALYAVAIAFLFSLPAAVYMHVRRNDDPYPFVPFLTAGFVLMQAWIMW